MNPFRRPLILIVILLFLLGCGIALARSSNIKGHLVTAAAEGCADECKERRDKMLERCEQWPEAQRERCQTLANTQYDKCVERCK